MDLNGEDQIKIILEKEKLNNVDIVNSCRYVFHCGDCCLFNITLLFWLVDLIADFLERRK